MEVFTNLSENVNKHGCGVEEAGCSGIHKCSDGNFCRST